MLRVLSMGWHNLITGTIAEAAEGKARITLDNGASIEAEAPPSISASQPADCVLLGEDDRRLV